MIILYITQKSFRKTKLTLVYALYIVYIYILKYKYTV